MAKKKNIVLAGYYGYSNLGDELIKKSILKSLRDRDPSVSVTVLERNPSAGAGGHKEIGRYNPFKIYLELLKAGTFMLGGGSLLQDRSGARTLYYYLLLIAAARLSGAKVILFNQGIGPVTGKLNYRLTGFVLSLAHIIIARDRASQTCFKDIIAPRRRKIFLGADPVFYNLPGGIQEKEDAPEGKKKIAFAVREWKKFEVKEKIKEAAAVLSGNYEVYNISFHRRRDSLRIPQVKEIGWSKVSDIWQILSRMDFIVGMRLHSLICAALSGIPAAGIVYDPKVESFCSYMEIPSVRVSNITPEKLQNLIRENMGKKNNYGEKSLALRQRYIESLDILFEAACGNLTS